jgi:hypothetical protein
MIRAVVLIVPSNGGYAVEAFDGAGAGLLAFPSPAFATAREAELHGLAELERHCIDPAGIIVDQAEQ